ncbi:MAG: hypothetical protein M3Y49_07230, partial [Actinomycetota bacterium]|nr:hypothetical protein [Actinomycetota bacterium]
AMSLYAEVTALRRRQALFDVLVILRIAAWGLIGWMVPRQAVESASGVCRLQDSGTGVATSLSETGEMRNVDLPLSVGGDLAVRGD